MVTAMNRSIDLLEDLAREGGNVSRMTRRGYLFASANPGRIPRFIQSAQEAADLGAGAARVHASAASDYRPSPADGFEDQPAGVDVITDRTLIRRHFPYLADDTVALFHGRRCGWPSGQPPGMHMPERARDKDVRAMPGPVGTVGTT